MRKPFIAGNWKMFKTNEEAVNLIQTIKAGVYKTNGVQIVVAPPATALSSSIRHLPWQPHPLLSSPPMLGRLCWLFALTKRAALHSMMRASFFRHVQT